MMSKSFVTNDPYGYSRIFCDGYRLDNKAVVRKLNKLTEEKHQLKKQNDKLKEENNQLKQKTKEAIDIQTRSSYLLAPKEAQSIMSTLAESRNYYRMILDE